MVDPQKLNELANSLYEHKLAISIDEAVKMAENILAGGTGETMSATGIPKAEKKEEGKEQEGTKEEITEEETEEKEEGAKKGITEEARPEQKVPEEEPTEQKESEKDKELKKDIAALEDPEEDAQDISMQQNLSETKKSVEEAAHIDKQNIAAAETIEQGIRKDEKEVQSLKKSFSSLEDMPDDADAVQFKEWEASKAEKWAEKKLPRQDLLKKADKIYEEESKKEEE